MKRLLPGFLAAIALAALSACGGSSGGGSEPTKSATGGAITVGAYDTHFDVGEITTTPGPLAVTLVNHGALQHAFKIEGTTLDLKADAGKSASGTVTLAAGTYNYECTVAGHKALGMKGKVVVG